jgi:hypothetical protein
VTRRHSRTSQQSRKAGTVPPQAAACGRTACAAHRRGGNRWRARGAARVDAGTFYRRVVGYLLDRHRLSPAWRRSQADIDLVHATHRARAAWPTTWTTSIAFRACVPPGAVDELPSAALGTTGGGEIAVVRGTRTHQTTGSRIPGRSRPR